jgi:hypothetical protein
MARKIQVFFVVHPAKELKLSRKLEYYRFRASRFPPRPHRHISEDGLLERSDWRRLPLHDGSTQLHVLPRRIGHSLSHTAEPDTATW